ncbi:ATP-binding cassette domain-containing protein [Microbacterium enclense]|uniref:ATP-binding cassette domain-containing protein n=1 Tax=Microbacterium enclense TaxID=993073 RepID=A0A3S3P458_9MICO|nr:ATP-binding cassette domain-containing protein [Microbacterium enclense]RWR19126.1 ATP-binding cassette domain-containing protein [Microbacterium enclense]
MPQGQVLEFSGLTKRFGAVSAVDGLTARVEPGLVTGFLGPNGAGKTTSLRMLLGLVRPTSGSATIGGRRYAEIDRPLQTVGAALEASSFHPGRSAANHLKAYARAARLPLSRIDEVLGLVGLADVAGRRVGGYSLGMRQRLGLATALLGDPGVLVLDEPSNGLDPEGIRWMRSLLRHLAEEGRTVLISSHLLAEVQQTVDALLIISRGTLVFQGGTEDLADPDEYSTVVDSPDRAALSHLLEERGIAFQLLRNGFTIRHVEPLEIGTLAAGAGIVLSHLQSKGASLEDIFLELVSGVRTHASAAGPASTAAPLTDAEEPETDAAEPTPEPASTSESAPLPAWAPPSTDLVPAIPARRSAPPDVPEDDPDPRPSYAVASTGVIDIVPVTDGRTDTRAADTEVPR